MDRLEAPAKVNLFLYVTGKRDDGYHNIVTWMQKIDLCDYMNVELSSARNTIEIACDTTNIPNDDNNLVVQAAKIFLNQSQRLANHGINIYLEKNIPVAAGLGGGSSDAGAILRYLNDCAEKEFSQKQLISMAQQLGADVPFFTISEQAVLAKGVGEIMQPIDSLKNYSFLLVNPGVSVSTAQIFENLVLTSENERYRITPLQQESLLLNTMHNDLEAVTFSLHPQLEEIKESLHTAGAEHVMMSGSGATMFGLFAKESCQNQEAIRDSLCKKYGKLVFWSNVYWGVAKR